MGNAKLFPSSSCLGSGRLFSTSKPDKGDLRMPSLMDFPKRLFPNLVNTARNWFIATTLITPYFDNEFSRAEFVEGAKAAVEYVSGALSEGEFDRLKSVVSPECLSHLKNRVSQLSMQQRQLLSVKKDDIFISFIYQIGILMEDIKREEGSQPEAPEHTRHVEITFVCHSHPVFSEAMEDNERFKNYAEIKAEIDNRGGPVVSNYRFIRDMTKGVDDQWTINVVNHFLLQEVGRPEEE